MSHVGEIPKGNIDVRVEKEHVSGQLWAARKGYKSRIKKKKMSVQEIEKQKLNYISTLREKKLTMLHLFAFV